MARTAAARAFPSRAIRHCCLVAGSAPLRNSVCRAARVGSAPSLRPLSGRHPCMLRCALLCVQNRFQWPGVPPRPQAARSGERTAAPAPVLTVFPQHDSH